MPKLLSYADVMDTASRACVVTDEKMNGLVTRFPQAVDCLLKLPYWVGDHGAGEPSVYRTWAFGAYVAAGHSFVALYQLLRSGFYLEALVLHRHLSEVLVQLIYFAEREQEAETHLIPVPPARDSEPTGRATVRRPKPVHFKTMFEAVAPGYYAHCWSPHKSQSAPPKPNEPSSNSHASFSWMRSPSTDWLARRKRLAPPTTTPPSARACAPSRSPSSPTAARAGETCRQARRYPAY